MKKYVRILFLILCISLQTSCNSVLYWVVVTNLTLVVSQISLCQVFDYQDQNPTAEFTISLILLLVCQQSAIFEPPGAGTNRRAAEINTEGLIFLNNNF